MPKTKLAKLLKLLIKLQRQHARDMDELIGELMCGRKSKDLRGEN